MSLPNPSNQSPYDDNNPHRGQGDPRKSATVRLVFNGACFVPSDSSEVGRTLLHHIKGRPNSKRYPITFSSAYEVELLRPNGTKILDTAIKVAGFIVGPNPAGEPSILELLSDKREKIRLPLLVVSDDWKVLNSKIGWNRAISKAIEGIEHGSSIVTFKKPGIYLSVLGDGESEIFKFPILIEKVRITAEGYIKEAFTASGTLHKPNEVDLDLQEITLPPASQSPEEFEEYTLAPIEPIVTIGSVPDNLQLSYSDEGENTKAKFRHTTPYENRESRIEIALCRLFKRELKSASAAQKPHLMAILHDAADLQKVKSEPLTSTFKNLSLGGGGSAKSKLVIASVERWQRHHQERNLFTELVWTQYYEDLTTIAPLMLQICADLARFGEAEAIDKRAARKKKNP